MHRQVTHKPGVGSARVRGPQTRLRFCLPRMAAAAFAFSAAPALLAGTATFDFGTDPNSTPGITLVSNQDAPWQSEGGNPGGFLAMTYPEDGQSSKILFPDIDAGKLVKAFKFEADLRVGNSQGDRGADGFSVSFLRGSDPILADPAMPDALFAGGIPEGGSTTGIAVSFDTWAGNTLPDTADIEGILVRVDNKTILRTPLATRHGACADATSLQTGPRSADYWANGGDPRSPESWSTLCWQPFSIELDDAGKLTVKWKGATLLNQAQTTYFPSVGRLLLAGRTGGENEHTHVDNIRITTTLATSPIVGLAQGDGCGFSVTIADAGTIVPNPGSIAMKLNGVAVAPSVTKSGDITTLNYAPPSTAPLASGSTNTVEVTFTDSTGAAISSTRDYIVPVYTTIPASAVAASFDAASSGFSVRVHQLDFGRTPGDANSIANAEQQLAGPFYSASGEPGANVAQPSGTADNRFAVETVNWNQDAPAAIGNFSVNSDPAIEDAAIPGIPGTTDSNNNIATEILTFLELKRGCNVLGVNSDDGFTVRLGHSPFGPLVGFFDGGRGSSDTTFRIYVAQDGVYPMRLSWWEAGGGANVEFFSVDAAGKRHLVNDRANTAAIKAYSSGRTGAYLSSITPAAGYLGAELRPEIKATFRNDQTSVDNASIRLLVDGQPVTATPATSGSTVTVSYTPSTNLLNSSAHTASVIYSIGGVLQTNTANFTVRAFSLRDMANSFVIEAENFDHSSGQIVDSVNTMPYSGGEYDGLSAVHNVDYFQPENVPDGNSYRVDENPNVPMGLNQDAGTLDMQRPGFEVTANYSIGWSGNGDWYNFTRTIPAGNYRIVGVQSHGDGAGTADRLVATFGIVTSGKGTTSQSVVNLGSYSTPSAGGWGNNAVSVAKSGGQDAIVRLPAGTHTFRVTVQSGDFDWFALVPTTDAAPAPGVSAVNIANGASSAQELNVTLTDLFRAANINNSTLKLNVNGQDVTSSATVTDTAGGATVRYTPTAGAVSYTVSFTDSTGAVQTYTGNFTSIRSAGNFVIEAEDFNYGGGQSVAAASTMPLQSGLYAGLAAAVHDVDYHVNGETPDSNLYRTNEVPNTPMDSTGDRDRGTFTIANNYKIGWVDAGEWYNYTRTFPNTNYNVYAALSNGDAAGSTAGSLQILSGASTNEAGTFNASGGTGGWGVNRLVPLRDSGGNLVSLPLSGAQTVRYTAQTGDFDYLVFTPASGASAGPRVNIARAGGNIIITWTGGGSLEASSVVGTGASWTVVDSDGSFTTTAEGSTRFFRVRQ